MPDVNAVTEPDPDNPSGEDILAEESTPEEKEVVEETPEPLTDVDEIEPKEEREEVEEEKVEEEVEEEPEVELTPRDQEIVKNLVTKYPTVLKEFPQIRSALYRDKEYTKVFPTPDDAKEAAELSAVFEEFQDSVLSGNPDLLIDNVGKTSPQALEKFALNFIPAMMEKHSKIYDKMVEPLARNLLYSAFEQGKASGNKNLELAARHLQLFYFNSKELPQAAKLGVEEKVDPERQAFVKEREETFQKGIIDDGIKEMRAKIDSKIDKSINKEMREVIIEKTLKGIGQSLRKDETYKRQRDSLYRKAARSNYAGDWGTRITGLYTGQATKLLPAVLGLVTKALLPGNPAKNPEPKPKLNVQRENEGSPKKKGNTTSLDGRKVDWSAVSPEEYLAKD